MWRVYHLVGSKWEASNNTFDSKRQAQGFIRMLLGIIPRGEWGKWKVAEESSNDITVQS